MSDPSLVDITGDTSFEPSGNIIKKISSKRKDTKKTCEHVFCETEVYTNDSLCTLCLEEKNKDIVVVIKNYSYCFGCSSFSEERKYTDDENKTVDLLNTLLFH